MLPVHELTIYAARAPHQSAHAQALAAGLRVHGIAARIERPEAPSRTAFVACWGWRYGQALRARGHEVLVMERGYVGDRFRWTSLGWNGLNGRATFRTPDDPARFTAHHAPLLRPWKSGGDYVLLIGQVPGDASLGGMDLSRWYEETAAHAARAYGLPVRFRPHPMAVQRGAARPVHAAPTLGGTLDEALAGAAIVVTFNSNTGVDAVLAGVPTVAADCGAMAWPMAGRRIGDRWTLDRADWAARLAWCQWDMSEIASGLAWETVRP
jgi:hypothetical protein